MAFTIMASTRHGCHSHGFLFLAMTLALTHHGFFHCWLSLTLMVATILTSKMIALTIIDFTALVFHGIT
jgi:hypothetical protein